MLCAGTAAAQTTGRVRDEAGAPVSGAVIEGWNGSRLLATTISNDSGVFALPVPRDSVAFVVARRVGYISGRALLDAADLVVVLRPRVTHVAGVEVVGRRACVERDEPAARQRWRDAQSRYGDLPAEWGASAIRFLSARVAMVNAFVPADSLGVIDTSRAQLIETIGTGDRFRNPETFYGRRLFAAGNWFDEWAYPWLWSVDAWHFGDASFGALNRLALVSADSATRQATIAFCSRAGSRPHIRGLLFIAPDGGIEKAEWDFVTRGPPERAGGEVVFMPAADSARLLLAASGFFWRQAGAGYFQQWAVYREWLLHAEADTRIRGRVVDEQGRAVPRALVEFWSPGTRLASAVTGDSGAFIGSDTIRPPVALIARRSGYLPGRAILQSSLATAEIRLRSRAALIEAIGVGAEAMRCVRRDSPAGRALWLAVAARYGPVPQHPDQRGRMRRALWGDGRVARSVVPPESLGTLDPTLLRDGMLTSGTLDRRPGEAMSFYTPAPSGFSGGRNDRYQYPGLEGMEAYHFADSLFGAWNWFGNPVPADDGGIELEFCSRRDGDARFISGSLVIGRDSSLERARWAYGTPDERAGGEVLFTPRSPRELLPPLSATGLAWRRNGRMVYQEWHVFDEWSVCAEDCRRRRPAGNSVTP